MTSVNLKKMITEVGQDMRALQISGQSVLDPFSEAHYLCDLKLRLKIKLDDLENQRRVIK